MERQEVETRGSGIKPRGASAETRELGKTGTGNRHMNMEKKIKTGNWKIDLLKKKIVWRPKESASGRGSPACCS